MHPSLRHTDHRPWPLPEDRWRWRQAWRHLAFFHYRVDARTLRPRVPDGLKIGEFDGSAWVGVVPFLMEDLGRGTLPGIPPWRSFPEINVRTYVEHDGRPGVWFFSLDADCWPIVLGARLFYGVPYFKASMSHASDGDSHRIESRRAAGGPRVTAEYRPSGPAARARAGSFEHWMAERYCLYSRLRGGLRCVDVHHAPWPVQPAEGTIEPWELLDSAAIQTLPEAPRIHYSSGVEVVSYAARACEEELASPLEPAIEASGPAQRTPGARALVP